MINTPIMIKIRFRSLEINRKSSACLNLIFRCLVGVQLSDVLIFSKFHFFPLL